MASDRQEFRAVIEGRIQACHATIMQTKAELSRLRDLLAETEAELPPLIALLEYYRDLALPAPEPAPTEVIVLPHQKEVLRKDVADPRPLAPAQTPTPQPPPSRGGGVVVSTTPSAPSAPQPAKIDLSLAPRCYCGRRLGHTGRHVGYSPARLPPGSRGKEAKPASVSAAEKQAEIEQGKAYEPIEADLDTIIEWAANRGLEVSRWEDLPAVNRKREDLELPCFKRAIGRIGKRR